MQPNENQGVSLPKERKQTDKSLETERARTDKLLLTEKERIERKADDAVLSNRAEADQLRIQTRWDADNSVVTESPDSDERLLQERESSDKALDTERRHVDTILEKERAQKESDERSFFKSEREETNKDLTNERRKNDAEVHRATAALTSRDEFLAIVSHDLRNPLASIAMAVDQLCGKQFFTAADEDSKELLDIIGRSADEALRLISDLMDMEQIAAGKLKLQMETYDICKIIRDSVNSFQSHALKKRISLRTDMENEAVVTAWCDRGRILQLLSNLIGNAIKFTPRGGTITLTARTNAGDAEISIADTGVGIPEEMLQKVFGRFLQIGSNDRHGLGLGLYISKMIVEAHGGRIWIDSKVGHGSTFHCRLPATLLN